MMNSFRPTMAQVNLDHLNHNFLQLTTLVEGEAFVCPMVKANAYGHGAVAISRALAEAGNQYLGVALVEEGIELRKASLQSKILVFSSFNKSALQACIEYKLTPVVSTIEAFHLLSEMATTPVEVHLKINMGMNRLGLALEDLPSVQQYLSNNKNIVLKGVCTHFACAEDLNSSKSVTQTQLTEFTNYLDTFSQDELIVHTYNSVGAIYAPLLKLPNYGIRPGIALYGGQAEIGDSVFDAALRSLDLKPVMQLSSQIVHIQKLKKGEAVSYGATWTAEKDTTIGVIPLGYADGFSRQLSNNWQVLVGDKLASVVGTVCMDYIMVNLTSFTKISVGEPCVIFGDKQCDALTALDMAERLNTISYEVLTSIGNRVPRVYKDRICN